MPFSTHSFPVSFKTQLWINYCPQIFVWFHTLYSLTLNVCDLMHGNVLSKINYHVFSLQYIQVKVGLLTPLYKVTDGWSMTSLTILMKTNYYSIVCILQNSTILPITVTYSCRVWTIKTKAHILVWSQGRKWPVQRMYCLFLLFASY